MYRAGQMAVKAEGKARAKALRLEGSPGMLQFIGSHRDKHD